MNLQSITITVGAEIIAVHDIMHGYCTLEVSDFKGFKWRLVVERLLVLHAKLVVASVADHLRDGTRISIEEAYDSAGRKSSGHFVWA